jgi:hypothetical protein
MALDFSKMRWKLREHPNPVNTLFSIYPDLEVLYNEVKMMYGDEVSFFAAFGEEEDEKKPRSLHEGLSPQQLMAFIVYAYHIHSPLSTEMSMHKRRGNALELIGFTDIKTAEGLEREKVLVQYIVGRNSFVNRLALHFCKFENNFDWIELCRQLDLIDQVFLTQNEEMLGTEKKSANEILDIKLKIESKLDGMRTRATRLAKEIFNNDTNLINYAAAHLILEKRKPIISPERYVAQQREKAGA